MQVTIQKKENNPLLKRTEVEGEIKFEGSTPSNNDLTGVLAKELKVDQQLIIIKNIYTEFSQQKATFKAVAYEDAEAKLKYEMSTKHLRKQVEESAKKAEEAKAAAEEEKKKAEEEAKAAKEVPAEEKKEETAPEEKPVEEPKEEVVPEEKPEAPKEEEKKEESPAEEKSE